MIESGHPPRHTEGVLSCREIGSTLLQRAEELLLLPTPSPTTGGQAELRCLSYCSSEGRSKERTALLLCYSPVCSSNYQITSPCLAFCCTHHAHTQRQEELQVLQKERMKLCMFALIHSSGPCLQDCPHDPLPAGTVLTPTKPRCGSAL